MKKYLLYATLVLTISSCARKTKKTDYRINNTTNKQIMIYSCAYTRGADGEIINSCLNTDIASGITYSMRAVDKGSSDADNYKAVDMFNVLDIYQDGIKTQKDVFNDSLWAKEIFDDKVEYTMTVDPGFF